MFDETQIANQNISFSRLTQNPQRQQANDQLARTLLGLEEDGIPSSMLAEVLFEYLMIEMEPDDPIHAETAITWFSQLNRFRDTLQSKIDQITDLYDDVPT